jgi:hypothetical protein
LLKVDRKSGEALERRPCTFPGGEINEGRAFASPKLPDRLSDVPNFAKVFDKVGHAVFVIWVQERRNNSLSFAY